MGFGLEVGFFTLSMDEQQNCRRYKTHLLSYSCIAMSFIGVGFCHQADNTNCSLNDKKKKLCDSYHNSNTQLLERVRHVENELKLLRARDKLSEVIYRFNELVIKEMVPYFTSEGFICASDAFKFRNNLCANDPRLAYFDGIYFNMAACTLGTSATAEFGKMLVTLRKFKTQCNISTHSLCSSDEANEYLETVLKNETTVQNKQIMESAFRLLIDKISTLEDEEQEMVFSPTFVMPPLRPDAAEFLPASCSTSCKCILIYNCIRS